MKDANKKSVAVGDKVRLSGEVIATDKTSVTICVKDGDGKEVYCFTLTDKQGTALTKGK